MQYAYPLLAIFIWAGNTVITKMSAGAIFPAEIGFYRWLLAGLLFTPFMLKPVLVHWPLIRPNLGKIFILGVLGMAVYQSLAYFAAALTSATNMGIILSLMPLMSLAMAIISLGQRLTAGALAGAVLSLAGVLVVVSSGSLGLLMEHGVNLGDAMMLIATLAYAVYSTLLKKWQLKLPPLVLLYLQVLVAVVVLFPLFLASPKVGPTLQNIPLVLYACLLASMVAPLAWMQAVVRLGPSRTVMFFNLLPVITALIAAVVLHEQLALYHLVGGVLTLGGVIVSERWTTVLGKKTSVA
ncbi:DMT family transporter [Pseudomonas sp. SWRI74]|jgi:drug/metabolite transporter (DMT)-like permease|uniref:DMT family transporter n=1 Tax=Pseudomonas azerbaijanoccidentalis TaxID=2842347 RepID=A0ABS6QTY8_9PSED|nr:DMT family transporter [Pseudomonas azerbaijanoccidentalis]MBV4522380.1 DMT family transporter [Pseudomonas azerbaijanoccidentalis]